MPTVLLLVVSNLFMTVAWYGHLLYKSWPLWTVIIISWLIALPEYCLAVPANRWGHGHFTAAQLKIMQEGISIAMFVIFSVIVLKEIPSWRDGVAITLIMAGLGVALYPR